MKLQTIVKSALVLGLSVFGAACDDGGDDSGGAGAGDGSGAGGGSGSGCGLAGRTGETECAFGNSTCQAGQYCSDDAFCEPGCTSDLNCASNEFCSKESGEAVGVCSRCMEMSGAGGGGGGGGGCASLAAAGAMCNVFPAAQQAVVQTACEAGLAGEDAAALNAAIACVNSAGGDCAQVQTCLGGGGGFGGGDGGAGGGNAGGCSADTDCDQTAGLTHQICSGGFCQIGCREDADCGNDYVCDTDFGNTCAPDDF